MKYVNYIVLAFSLVVLAPESNAADSYRKEIEELKTELKRLQEKISRLENKNRSEKHALQTGEDKWFKGVKVITEKGTGLTFSTIDENYKLRLRLAGQFKSSLIESDGNNDGISFEVERARLQFDGNAFRPWFKYFVQLDLADSVGDRDVTLLDLRFDFEYNRAFVPRVGQYRVPFNREELTSTFALQFVERSSLNSEFEYDRDTGVGLWGELGKWFYYQGGIFQGDGEGAPGDDDFDLLWALRVQVSPFGEDQAINVNFARRWSLAIGFAVAGINIKNGSDSETGGARFADFGEGVASGQVFSISSDFSLKNPRFNIEGEYNGRITDPAGFGSVYDHGVRIQAGVFLIQKILEVAGRINFIDYDNEIGNRDARYEFTPGINYYLSKDHRWKIQFDYTFIHDEFIDLEDADSNILRAQLQTYF